MIGQLSAVVLVATGTAVWSTVDTRPSSTRSPSTDAAHSRLHAETAVAHVAHQELGDELVLRMQSLELTDVVLTAESGTVVRVDSSTFSGTVVLRAKSLSGKLFGQVPITLDGTIPLPPLPAPQLTMTDIVVEDVQLTASTTAVRHFSVEQH
ncbi:hypothetical protein Q5530_06365 [Saccharothrix sp. BKS2]|uniref:hypothetical protein n=1 Tax=Saccharothrix sp. BKS2 TaxID=3064400 RepID=UPI0039E7B87B